MISARNDLELETLWVSGSLFQIYHPVAESFSRSKKPQCTVFNFQNVHQTMHLKTHS